MKTNLSTLERAEDALMKTLANVPPVFYIRELEKLCKACGWSLREYWQASIINIDANWDNQTVIN